MSAIPFLFTPETHTFTTPDGVRLSVTQILAKNGICDFSFVDQETRLYSMDRGSKVHWLTELEDGGGLNYRTVPKWLRGFRKGWNTWKRRSSFQINTIEERFVSRFGYAGIIDRTGMFPPSVFMGWGTSAVVDIKSGVVADYVRYQLCAYAVWAAGDNPKRAEYIRRIALRLNADGSYVVREFACSTFLTDWARFMQWTRKANQ